MSLFDSWRARLALNSDFQKFVVLLGEYLLKCETEGTNFNTDWFRLAAGRLRQVFLVVSIDFDLVVWADVETASFLATRRSCQAHRNSGTLLVHSRYRSAFVGNLSSVLRIASLSILQIRFPVKMISFSVSDSVLFLL